MLTRTQYLKLCLVLPFVGGLLAAALVFSSALVRLPQWLLGAATLAWMAIAVFGIPYALLASVTAVLLRRRSWGAHVFAAIAAPLLMLFAIAVALWLSGDRSPSRTIAALAPSCLGIGYFYVALAFGGLFVISRRGWIAR